MVGDGAEVEEGLDFFPVEDLKDFGFGVEEFLWTQEEPKNMGAWSFVEPRFVTAMRSHAAGGSAEEGGTRRASEEKGGGRVRVPAMYYMGRAPAASPATGSPRLHAQETRAIIDAVFDQPRRDRFGSRWQVWGAPAEARPAPLRRAPSVQRERNLADVLGSSDPAA